MRDTRFHGTDPLIPSITTMSSRGLGGWSSEVLQNVPSRAAVSESSTQLWDLNVSNLSRTSRRCFNFHLRFVRGLLRGQ